MKKNLNEYCLSPQIREKLKDYEFVKKQARTGKTCQELAGFSDAVMANFYKVAYHFFETKKYIDAVNSFIFLASLNPHNPEYWLGLGMSAQMCHDYETAIDAYELCACIDIANPVPYFYLAKCFFAIHERDNSLEALNLAIELAGGNEDFQQLRLEAETAKNLLLKT